MELRHAYIISSANQELAFSKAMEIARCAVNTAKDVHPDIIVIRKGEGKAKNEISVDQVRGVISDSIVLPNQSERKVYIFADGGTMKDSAQNAALKLLEEPPKGVILILCTHRPDVFLPTVRSRCVEMTVTAEIDFSSELADEFIKLLASGDERKRFHWLEDNNKMSIPEAKDFCSAIYARCADMLTGRCDSFGMDSQRLFELSSLMEKCIDYLSVNVTVKQVFGLLEIF